MFAFFINRPIFASVISIVIVLAGLAALPVLPVAEYPEISPPTVMIRASYPGASAQTLASTVAAPIERELSGIEGLAYFSTSAATNGTVTITVTFQVGTDVDMASVEVSNRVRIAEPRLPEEVRRNGVQVAERSDDSLMVVGFDSVNTDRLFLSNYITLNVVDEILRLEGVGDVIVLGAQDYSMRIWLDPDRMAQRGVTASDIVAAIREQNTQNAAGRIGQEPAPASQRLTYTVTAKGRLITPEEFGSIVLRSSGPGGVLRLEDVARVELGSDNYDGLRDGKWPSGGGHERLSAIRGQCAGNGRSRAPQDGRARRGFSGGRALRDSDRLHGIHHGIDQGRDDNALRGRAAGGRGGVPVPAELACHAAADDCGACLAHRHLRGPLAARLLHQHAHDVRSRVVHRHRGRRCDHRHRERRATDVAEEDCRPGRPPSSP